MSAFDAGGIRGSGVLPRGGAAPTNRWNGVRRRSGGKSRAATRLRTWRRSSPG